MVEHYITFRVARQDFAMDASCVRGLLPAQEATLLAAGGWIVGIASLRGHDFPVVDLRAKLGIAAAAPGRRPCIIAVEVRGGRLIGFIADRVSKVIQPRASDLRNDHVRVEGRRRSLLDPEQIISDEELENFSRVAAGGLYMGETF